MNKFNKHKNQDGLRKPTSWPPNVRKICIIEFQKWRPEPTIKKRGVIRKAL
jgi:hypothetical protein